MLIVSSTEQIQVPTAIALGNFDGIHQGHKMVLQPIVGHQQFEQQPHVYPSVVSFSPHPREFFTGKQIKLLTPIAEKSELLSDLGIEQLILLPFNQDLSSLSPQQFVEQILVKQLQAKSISVGLDFRFGYQRRGTAENLSAIGASFGIQVYLNSLHRYANRQNEKVRVSSSLIREALTKGEIKTANQMLGRPYSIIGKVVPGKQLGRTIGFPTANLEPTWEKFLPRFGVYSGDIYLKEGTEFKGGVKKVAQGVMNIGCRPTVAGELPTIEAHLLNWSGDLYGQTLRVDLIDFLRPEQKFASIEELKQQITIDCQAVLNN